MSSQRVTGALGLLGVACTTASAPVMPIWGFPGTAASAADVAAFVHGRHAALVAGMVLNLVGVSLWLALGAGVWARLQAAGDRYRVATACFGLGYASFVTLILAGFLVFVLLIGRIREPPTARLLYDMTFGLLAVSGAPTALALAGFAAHVARSRELPAYTLWTAALAAVCHVALVFTPFVGHGFFSLEGQVITAVPGTLFLWLLAVGIAVVRHPDTARPDEHLRLDGRDAVGGGCLDG